MGFNTPAVIPGTSSLHVPASVNARPGTSCSEEMDEFSEELQFDPTISSGFFGGLGQGGFRSTPITVGVCPTPQPAAPTPQPTQQQAPTAKSEGAAVEAMTPTEADNLLAERLMERRSRAGSVLSDQQAE